MAIIYGTPFFISGGSTVISSLPPLLDQFQANYEAIPHDDTKVTITLSAQKLPTALATDLAGAVWVYGDHAPANANDGTRIVFSKEQVVSDDNSIPVSQSITWGVERDFFARQFTHNAKNQYQTMSYGATASLKFVGVPKPVTELSETHTGSYIDLTWKNPVNDPNFHHVVAVSHFQEYPTEPSAGTELYNGTGTSCHIDKVTLGASYHISVFSVSADGTFSAPVKILVQIPAGKLLSSLPSGTKVKLGQYGGKVLQWKVARDTSNQAVRLVLEPVSMGVLGNKMYDNKEPSNGDDNRRNYGNNRYIWSNIHQWLNSTKGTNWYTAQHGADAPPDYNGQAGFLNGWDAKHLSCLDRTNWVTTKTSVDGGGTESFTARVALLSTTELGLQNATGNGKLDIFNSNGDRATGGIYWTRSPYPSFSYVAYQVYSDGTLYYVNTISAYGVRPLCTPLSSTLVSLEMDDENCYTVV